MNLPHPSLFSPRRRSASQRGSAVLVVLVLIACMAIMLNANSRTLYTLKQELRLLNAQQQSKYAQPARP